MLVDRAFSMPDVAMGVISLPTTGAILAAPLITPCRAMPAAPVPAMLTMEAPGDRIVSRAADGENAAVTSRATLPRRASRRP